MFTHNPRSKIKRSCLQCGKHFFSRIKQPKFCSWTCSANSKKIVIDIGKAVKFYQAGLSFAAVSKQFNCSAKTIQNSISDYVVSHFPAAFGECNARWKGNNAKLQAFHTRLYRKRGKPSQCSQCGIKDPRIRYEWANLTGNYSDPNNYKRMCVKCHRHFDLKRAGGSHNQRKDITTSVVVSLLNKGLRRSDIARRLKADWKTIDYRIKGGTLYGNK